jgi:hypothetical protein
MKVLVADMLDLPFEPETFDLVIEKGTMVCTLISFFQTFQISCEVNL